MGGHPKNQQGGGASMPAAAPAAPAGPKLVNNQIPAGLRGAGGGAWTPEQTQAGGRWEVPAGAPAGAIGRNWVTAPAPRDQLAGMMSPSPNPYAEGGMSDPAAVHNPFYNRMNPRNPYFRSGRPVYPGASGR